MTTRITVKKIAELCGISQPVVSAILNRGKSAQSIRFSQETADRVMAVADEYGYRPNRVAQYFNSKRHHILGVLIHEAGNMPTIALRNLLKRAGEFKQLICLESIAPGQKELPVFLRKDCVDGVLLFEELEPDIHAKIAQINLPAVCINTSRHTGVHNVVYDEIDAITQAVELFEKGSCDRYVMTRSYAKQNHYSTRDRLSTLRWLAHEKGHPEPTIIDMDNLFVGTDTQQQEVFNKLVDTFKQPGKIGLIDCVPYASISIIQAMHQAGRNVPDDLMHIMISNDPIAMFSKPSITMLRVDMNTLILDAVTDLSRIIDGKAPIGPPVVKYHLIVGDSTRI